MAFDKAGLTRIGGDKRSTAPTIWTYRTNDALATVDGAGYFDNGDTTNTGMRNHMSVGDFIFCHATADTIATFGLFAVNANASGIIDVASANLLGTIDSD
jgi:hypothetical protein